MKNLSVNFSEKDLEKARAPKMPEEYFNSILEHVLEGYPGLAQAMKNPATSNPGVEFSGLENLRANLRHNEDSVLRELLRATIDKRLARLKDIFWVPFTQPGVEYTMGYAPGNILYQIAPYVNSRTDKDKFIVMREYLADYHSFAFSRDYLSDDLTTFIKAPVRKNLLVKNLEPYSVSYWDNYSRSERHDDIKERNYMFSRASARIFKHTAYSSLQAAQAACKEDWVRVQDPEKLIWTDYSFKDLNSFYGAKTLGDKEAYYRLTHKPDLGFQVEYYPGPDAPQPTLLHECEPDGERALDLCEEHWIKSLATKSKERD